MRTLTIVSFSLGCAACGVRELPPVAAPAQEMPVVQDAPTTAPLPTNSRVTFDANGETAKVMEVTGEMQGYGYVGRRAQSMSGIITKMVCGATPCVADLPKGDHEMVFARPGDPYGSEQVDIKVGDPQKVVRHAFGYTSVSPVWVLGVSVATLGVVSLAFSWMPFLFAGATKSQDTHDGLIEVGDGMLIGGAIAFVGGLVTSILTRPEHAPGSTTQWDVPGTAPAVQVLPNNPSPIQPVPGGVQF